MRHRGRPPAKGLTPRQADVLHFITGYMQRNGYPPTLQEIATGIGITSRSTALFHVQELEHKGFVEIAPTTRRPLRVIA